MRCHAITHDESVLIAGPVVDGVFHQNLVLSFPRGMPLNRQADLAVSALPGNCEIYVDQTGEAGVQCLAEYGRLNARVHGFDYGRADAKAHLMS